MNANLKPHRRKNPGTKYVATAGVLTSTAGDAVGNDIRQNSRPLHHRQKPQGLLPSLAPLTSTEGSCVENDIK